MGEISSCCCISSSCSSNTSPQAAAEVALQRVGSGVSAVSSEVEESESISRVNKLPSSQFKGVVPQPNGRWGAQIYEKHRRVWLGTFNLERDAAWAYDLAAQRFRGRDAVTNFPPLTHSSSSSHELSFLLSRSKAEVVDMLRKHTYLDELQRCPPLPCGRSRRAQTCSHARELLFDKAVTPSDVGKLNRLVIPKQHAEKHFPIPEGAKGLLLSFEDGGKIWRFRYSYWNSSQSYVLTKGWSRFVKEKALLPGDSVAFYRSKPGSDRKLYIECRPRLRIVVLRLFGVDISVLGQAPTAEIKRKLCCVSVDAAADSCLLKKPRIGS